MNEEIHDRFYDDIDGEKHFNSTQLVERYHCEGNGALCDMDCENCELYKKYYTKEPCPYCDESPKPIIERNGFKLSLDEDGDIFVSLELGDGTPTRVYKTVNYCPMCGRKLEDV